LQACGHTKRPHSAPGWGEGAVARRGKPHTATNLPLRAALRSSDTAAGQPLALTLDLVVGTCGLPSSRRRSFASLTAHACGVVAAPGGNHLA